MAVVGAPIARGAPGGSTQTIATPVGYVAPTTPTARGTQAASTVNNPDGTTTYFLADGTQNTGKLDASGNWVTTSYIPPGAIASKVTDTAGNEVTIYRYADGRPVATDPVTKAWSQARDAADPTKGIANGSGGPIAVRTMNPDGTYTTTAIDGGSTLLNKASWLAPIAGGVIGGIVGGPGGAVIGAGLGYKVKTAADNGDGANGAATAAAAAGHPNDRTVNVSSDGTVSGATGGGTGGGGGGGGGPVVPFNPGGAQTAVNGAQTLQQQFSNAYQNFKPSVAPMVQQVSLAPQQYASAGQVGGVQQVQAPNVGSAQQVQAAQVGSYLQAAGYAVQAGHATAQQIGALERVQPGIVGQIQNARADQVGALIKGVAQQVGPIERVQGVGVQGVKDVLAQQASASTLDAQQQAEFRQNQKTLLGYLNGAIDGTAPSVAKLQLDQATQRNEANQLGLAASSSRGGNSALAMRTAANNIGMLNQRAASDAAMLRAQEVATARGQYGEVANAGRTTDVSLAGQNASLLTGVSQSNAGLGTQAGIANASNAVSLNSLRAQLAQQAQTTNANNNLAASTTNATLGTQTSLANAANDLSKQQTNATLGTQVSVANAKNQLDAQSLQAQLNQQASTANAGNSLAAQQTNATLGTQASIANANNVTSANTATAANATQASVANANNSLAAQIAQAKLTQDASTSNAANATSLQQLQAQLIYNASHDNAGNALSAAQTNANLQTQASTANANNATSLNVAQGQITNAGYLANAANQVTTAGQNITAQQNAAGNALTASGQVIAGQGNILDNSTRLTSAQLAAQATRDAATMQRNGQVASAGIGAVGAALPILAQAFKDAPSSGGGSTPGPDDTLPLGYGDQTSDRRAKTNIRDGRSDAQNLLDHLTARSFKYKDPAADGAGDRTGVMAQDVEKSRAGKAFVKDTPTGKKLDPSAGFGSVLAMLSTLNERTKKLEARRA